MDLSYNGSVLATALYGPYGVGRYATGTMPSSKGYTGQRQDSGSGLDYYMARYYDGAIGQFTSADSVQGPNRYGYVGGNPETENDPTGKRRCDDRGACGGDGGGGHGSKYSFGIALWPPCHYTCDDVNAVSSAKDSDLALYDPCSYDRSLCAQIETDFRDPRTILLLDWLVASMTGREFLAYILYMADTLGDAFITWDSGLGQKAFGYTKDNGRIYLNPELLKFDSVAAVIEDEDTVIHEATESYFDVAQGIGYFGASRHMEYVADHFGGKVVSELDAEYGGFAAIDPAFSQSYSSLARYYAQTYPDEPTGQWETSLLGILRVNYFGPFPTIDSNAPNPMGLTSGLLNRASLVGV